MGECKVGGGGGDCLIKLFGKTIPVPESRDGEKDAQHSGSTTTESTAQEHMHQDSAAPRPEVLDTEEDSAAMKSSSSSSGGGSGSPKEKLKKPDKILPCPRCSSMDTKFCYYNNYNVNQPRHFCKNCQRYWTAGGAMRNVPVGSGRRKNKNAAAAAASHFLQRVGAALPIKTNGTVLSFSSDASGLDLTEQMLHLNDKLVPAARARNSDDPSIGSRVDGSSNGEDKNQTVEKPANGVQHPCINGGAMWPYGCAPSPAYYTTSIAIPFYSAAAYWGCMVPGAWGAPWLPQSQAASSCNNAASSASSAPTSLTAPGKHPREGDEEGDGRNGACKVWAPKTIRIDNADDVARSSIWSLLGTKGDKVRMDGVFEPKGEAKASARAMVERLPLLQANPVALSRSATFQEGS